MNGATEIANTKFQTKCYIDLVLTKNICYFGMTMVTLLTQENVL